MALTHFSGFSGKSIDFSDSQDVKNNELSVPKIRFSNPILSARLISVLDFIFALSMTPPEDKTSVLIGMGRTP